MALFNRNLACRGDFIGTDSDSNIFSAILLKIVAAYEVITPHLRPEQPQN